MKKKYTVSFIIPVRNGSATIAATLTSIAAQNKKPYEVIVVDNGSTDSTREIVKSFGNIKYIFHAKKGRSRARNKGASIAKGSHLAFVDADVVLEPDWLKNSLSYLEKIPVDALATRIEPKEGDRHIVDLYRREFGNFKSNNTFLSLATPDGPYPLVNTAACLFSKASFQKVGGFDTKLVRHEDLDLSIRMHAQGYFLGGTSAARAKVCFESNRNIPRNLSYAARAFEVKYFSPNKAIFPHLNISLLKTLWKRNHSLRLMTYAMLVEIAGNLGAFANNLLAAHNQPVKPIKRGLRNFLPISFPLGSNLYILKINIGFIFLDQCAYALFYRPGSNRAFQKLNQICTNAIVKLCKKKTLSQEEAKAILKLELFRDIHAK